MNKILSLILLLSLLTACEQYEPIELPDTDPILTANCFAKVGKTWRVYVSSGAATDEFTGTFENLENATVKISGNTTDLTLNHIENGLYESSELVPTSGQYELEVTHADYPPLTANLTILPEPKVSNINFIVSEDGRENFLEFELEDVPDVENYYFVAVKAIRMNPGGWIDSQLVYFDGNTPVVSFNITNSRRSNLFFSDQLFQGNQVSLKFDTNTSIGDYTDVVIEIAHADENFYLYNETVEQQSYTGENPFAEPVFIHSNVDGGLGIFAAYHSISDTISIE